MNEGSVAAISTFTLARTVSIGYLSHSDTAVRLYLQETFTFLVAHRGGCRGVGSSWEGEEELRRDSDSSPASGQPEENC